MMKVAVQGGLGNQLFQWAFGHLNAEAGFELVRPSRPDRTDRTFELQPLLRHCSHVRNVRELRSVSWSLVNGDLFPAFVPGVLNNLFSSTVSWREPKEFAPPTSVRLPRNRIARGYFQHTAIVDDVLPLIQSEMDAWMESHRNTLRDRLPSTLSVIHVRRGDLSSPELRNRAGLLGPVYYLRALEALSIDPKTVVLCTDDPLGAQDVSRALRPAHVLGPADLDVVGTLQLMSQANYVVTANSTLSWWGGRLASRRGGQVAIPSPWFRRWNPDPANAFQFSGALGIDASWTS